MDQQRSFILKGKLVDTTPTRELRCWQEEYLICENGRIAGVAAEIPERYAHLPLVDHSGKLIIPGLCDLHVHAPQYAFRGTGMDLELLDWLERYTFPEESRYADLDYAERAYGIFAQDLKKSMTTRACVFATIHTPASLLLMELLEQTGLQTMVGKVNMDRNCPDFYREQTEVSLADTQVWITQSKDRFTCCKPILTPRFTPTCTDALLAGLGRMQQETGLAMQSHLSENPSEIEWVKELCPDTACYADSYAQHGLFGGDCPTIMAHCVYSGGKELDLIRQNGVFLAHCPQSNTNLSSGIAPVRRWLDEGVHAGLGTDIAGGSSLSLFRAMVDTIQGSKLRWRLVDSSLAPLTMADALYLATRGGGAFFGKVGCFEPGYELDALVLDDSAIPMPRACSVSERLERMIYLADDRQLAAKYAAGRQIL